MLAKCTILAIIKTKKGICYATGNIANKYWSMKQNYIFSKKLEIYSALYLINSEDINIQTLDFVAS